MKKCIIGLLLCALLVGLCGCSGKKAQETREGSITYQSVEAFQEGIGELVDASAYRGDTKSTRFIDTQYAFLRIDTGTYSLPGAMQLTLSDGTVLDCPFSYDAPCAGSWTVEKQVYQAIYKNGEEGFTIYTTNSKTVDESATIGNLLLFTEDYSVRSPYDLLYTDFTFTFPENGGTITERSTMAETLAVLGNPDEIAYQVGDIVAFRYEFRECQIKIFFYAKTDWMNSFDVIFR